MPPLTPDQRARRRWHMTGTTYAAAKGHHPYLTPLQAALHIRGDWEQPTNEAMAWGTALEPVVAAMWAKRTGHRVRACTHTHAHDIVPAMSHPDYHVLGHRVLLEAKASARPFLEALPDNWRDQAVFQVATSAARSVEVVALAGLRLYTWTVEPDRAEVRSALNLAADWIAALRDGWLPEPDHEQDPADVVLRIAPLPTGTVEARGQLRRLGDRMARTVRKRKRAEEPERAARATLVEAVAKSGAQVILGRDWTARVLTAADGRRQFRFAVDPPPEEGVPSR